MQELQGVHHAAVSVPDLETARRFYVELLGARELSKFDWPRGTDMVNQIVGLPDSEGRTFMCRLGNVHVEVFEYAFPEQPPQDPRRPVNHYGYTHLCFQVSDIHAVYERMLSAGLTFHCPPQHSAAEDGADPAHSGFWATYGRDFFGNVFELIEINTGSSIDPL